MAKLLGPDFISLQVRSIAASRVFYTDTLGLRIDERFDTPDFVLFETNSIPFGLSGAPVEQSVEPRQPGQGVALWLDCDDVDALHERVKMAGSTIIRPPSDGPFGRSFVFTDPDGYRITANQNPWDRFPLGGRGAEKR